ncbi:hypothetical protein AWENTII_004343 [Aspergillus wentii]
MLVFGLATLATGFVQNYGGLLGLRSVLGMTEAGIMPGCAYLMSAWYTRQEAQRRFSFYLSAMNLSSGFGGLIAAPIGNMDGAGGLSGWRWIFIVEGAATCLISLSLFFLLANFPEQVSWLTEEERGFVKARLKAEQGSSAIELSIRPFDVWQTLCDPKVIFAAMIHLSTSVPGYMGAYFAPVIVESLGVFSPIETQLHTVPIWAVTFGLALIVAYISDLIRHRYAMAVFCAAVSIVGYSILFSVHEDNVNVRYGALFMAIAGAAILMPGITRYYSAISITQLTGRSGNMLEHNELRRSSSSSHWERMASRHWQCWRHHWILCLSQAGRSKVPIVVRHLHWLFLFGRCIL